MATFTTPDVNSLPDDFAAIIDYGDGTTDTGGISGGSGSFTVTADHVYAEKGTYTVSIQIFNGLTGASTTTSTTATVADGVLTLTGGFESGDPITANLGGFQLATLTDANPDATSSDFSVTVNWGDGEIDTNAPMVHVLNIGPGLFAISGSHSYPNPWPQGVGPVTYTVSISVTDADGSSASTTSTVVVGNIEPGLPATMGGWVFIDQNYYGSSSDFVYDGQTGVVEINWGDGTTSLGTISTLGGGNGAGPVTFGINAKHTYTQDSLDQPGGLYPITVTVTDDDGNVLTGIQHVSVVRPPMNLDDAGNVDISKSLTVSNAPVAMFAVPDALDPTSEFTAQIDWGDGTVNDGTIQEIAPGLYQVQGSHTYAVYDWYKVTVSILQDWQAPANAARQVGAAGGRPIITIEDYGNKPTSTLSIAKWETAFRLGNGQTKSGLNNIKLRSYYPYLDHDSFRVKIIDDYYLPFENKPINVRVSTSSNPAGHLISVPYFTFGGWPSQDGGFSGMFSVFLSKPLILVSIPVDDTYEMQGKEGSLTDPTFLAYLGDTVKVSYRGKIATVTVPIKSAVKLHITILNITGLGVPRPVVTAGSVDAYFELAKKIYAQTGIKLVLEGGIGGIKFTNQPPGVNLSGGFPFVSGLSSYDKAVLDLDPRTPKNYIAVYYVNYFKQFTSSGFIYGSPLGISFPGAVFTGSNAKYADSTIVAADDATLDSQTGEVTKSRRTVNEGAQTLAHEIGHLLLNTTVDDHLPVNVFVNRINLMAAPFLEGMAEGEITDRRRITAKQAEIMLKDRPNLLSNP